jgi:phosphate acyltransferase
MHAKGHCDAFISAGNTGALLAASAFILGRLPGVMRPTIASNFPTIKGVRLMVDVGANIEVKPEMLYQFGIMGSVYARKMLGIESPRIGLINVGEEEEKGDETLRKAHELLKSFPGFAGNVEGRDILPGAADVYVCDGFVGNVLLKFGESVPEALTHIVKQVIMRRGLDQQQIELVVGVLREAFAPFDYQLVGGVPFLGVNGVSLVGHGGSTPKAIKSMIFMAEKMVNEKVNEAITTSLN